MNTDCILKYLVHIARIYMNTIVLDGLDYTGSDPGPMGAADDHRMALWCMRLDDIVISFKYLYGERRLGLGHKPE